MICNRSCNNVLIKTIVAKDHANWIILALNICVMLPVKWPFTWCPGAGCTKAGQRYPPDSDFFNRRKNA